MDSRASKYSPLCFQTHAFLRLVTHALRFLFILLWSACLIAHAQFNYVTNNGAITITGYSGGPGTLSIPETIDGLTVSAIAASAFETNADLTNVVIPKTVISIGTAAFASCINLVTLDVDPENTAYKSSDGVLYSVGLDSLVQCPGGKRGSFVAPDGLTAVGSKAFAFCAGLTNIALPNSVTSIGDNAFANCSGLTSFSVPTGVTSISNATFSSCSRMGSISIPNSVTSIGDYAFTFCGLTNVTLPEGVRTICNVAFAYCSKLTRVWFPNSVTSIGTFAFSSCSALRELYFAGDCPVIGASAFSNANQATVFYLTGSTGWDSFSSRPAILWNATIVSSDASFGGTENQFGFTIGGNNGLTVVVEFSPSLENPTWQTIYTNTVSAGLSYRDAAPVGASGFYRLRSP